MSDIRECLKFNRSCDPIHAVRWNEICDKADNEKEAWISRLRKEGYKAAHPNDGWVNRDTNEMFFAYPHFNDGAKAGDKVMLGWPSGNERPIKLVAESKHTLMTWWKFEDIEATNEPTD